MIDSMLTHLVRIHSPIHHFDSDPVPTRSVGSLLTPTPGACELTLPSGPHTVFNRFVPVVSSTITSTKGLKIQYLRRKHRNLYQLGGRTLGLARSRQPQRSLSIPDISQLSSMVRHIRPCCSSVVWFLRADSALVQ